MLCGGEIYRQPGFKVDVIDTFGCGDAFLASWLAGMLAGNEPRQILAEACAIGAKIAAASGANPATA